MQFFDSKCFPVSSIRKSISNEKKMVYDIKKTAFKIMLRIMVMNLQKGRLDFYGQPFSTKKIECALVFFTFFSFFLF
ncbi:hypothetical protein FHW36_112132 [Chitinophaga polysaccharea]|uniref:Uncharacterized protein n=1 Tax=Chitinophaga polysaccharea TaxID=1293035 RepID=A0A561P6G1_9BACT|nr:hypothetical protein FHW36_112132 [Chitinophaga polysaccharea]